jgi:hypothetical protein
MTSPIHAVGYAKSGFQDLPFDPGRAMIVRMVDLKRSGIGAYA